MNHLELYPPIEPYNSGHIDVSPIHSLYFEEVGNPEGKPVLFLHGGPGAGIDANCRRFFDPEFYRIILFDQRGCGNSKPYGELTDNTTWDLVDDIEKLRNKFGIDKWLVFGGSWGATLALVYTICHPDKVLGLVLRGIWLSREREIYWTFRGGAAKIYPDSWEKFMEPVPNENPETIIEKYYDIFCNGTEAERTNAAQCWSVWEASISKLVPSPELIADYEDLHKAIAIATIECHYFINNFFGQSENFILENVDKIADIPSFIVNGRYDIVCPMISAWELKKHLNDCELVIAPLSGHSTTETEIYSALVSATEKFKKVFDKDL